MRRRELMLLMGAALYPRAAWALPRGGRKRAPRLVTLRPEALLAVRARLAGGDQSLAPALSALVRRADGALKQPPVSVTEKERLPPSGDKRDYLSQAPYYWPDPSRPDGRPYIRRDGETNPEAKRDLDHRRVLAMRSAVTSLATAHFFTGNEAYARHAVAFVRTFFLDPRTRMNPHLNYSQGIPGVTDGRAVGVIDTRTVIDVLDAIGLLELSPAWTRRDGQGLQAWATDFLRWLRESPQGREEQQARNNHGTWYDAQVAAFAVFTGQTALAREIVAGVPRRIDAQIRPDGSQPEETRRTRSLHYSAFNLEAHALLAEMGRAVRAKVDLWTYASPTGGSLLRALDALAPYADPAKTWPEPQAVPADPDLLVPHFLRADQALGRPRYAPFLAKIPKPLTEAHPARLHYAALSSARPRPDETARVIR